MSSLIASMLRYRYATFQTAAEGEDIWLTEVVPALERRKDESFMEWAVRVGLAPERTEPANKKQVMRSDDEVRLIARILDRLVVAVGVADVLRFAREGIEACEPNTASTRKGDTNG